MAKDLAPEDLQNAIPEKFAVSKKDGGKVHSLCLSRNSLKIADDRSNTY